MIMNMSMEILEEFSGSDDQMIVKGKRSKRARSSSSASSSGEFYNNNSFVSSPATSTTTEEDEDMANCLILLARGRRTSPPPPPPPPPSSRKLAEMNTSTNGKVGIYVYECKTCNRSFPSFQALGGHRASHKKPKTTTDIDHMKSMQEATPPPANDHKQQQQQRQTAVINKSSIAPPPSTPRLQNENLTTSDENKNNKIHECSICGSEFASGQALGGHMRRHRSAPTTAINSTRIDETSTSTSASHDVEEKTGRSMLELDLNLPAPEDDDKFQPFAAASQQTCLVFSTAALVDCHY